MHFAKRNQCVLGRTFAERLPFVATGLHPIPNEPRWEWTCAAKRSTGDAKTICPSWTRLSKSRVRLLEQDVRKRNRPQADVLAAQNFSFWYFKTRAEVIDYFKTARANLAAEGIMVMDMMGGSECYQEDHVDKRTIKKGKKGFKYHWYQARFDPISADATFYIHFKFADGSKLEKAFEYQWRFWTIPEVREMLAEAGFKESHVYWEREDEDGEGDGTWGRCVEAPSDPSWICYIVAVK